MFRAQWRGGIRGRLHISLAFPRSAKCARPSPGPAPAVGRYGRRQVLISRQDSGSYRRAPWGTGLGPDTGIPGLFVYLLRQLVALKDFYFVLSTSRPLLPGPDKPRPTGSVQLMRRSDKGTRLVRPPVLRTKKGIVPYPVESTSC